MNDLALRLLPDGRDPQELVLQKHRQEYTILDTLNSSSAFVFCDYPYTAQLINAPKNISNVVFLLNGVEIGINYSPSSGEIFFQDSTFRAQIFRECYGFAQITIMYTDEFENQTILETEYIQVMVRKGPRNDAVKRMTEFVYSQNASLLVGFNTIPKDTTGMKESEKKTIESHILLLEKISLVYEENYRYFKTNSRFSVVPRERVDYFEKLQYVSQNTIKYISRHPEELQPIFHPKGIRIGKSVYQPNKTLITDNSQSFDIYENRVILGFLRHLLSEVERIKKELIDVLEIVPQKPLETDEYITSSYFIYANTISMVKTLLRSIHTLSQKYTQLYYSYAEILPIPAEPINRMPRLTAVFRSVPQYHQIYDCAFLWFSNGVFTIREEQFMLSVIKISTLYEIYVLTKMLCFFQKTGYSLVASERIVYTPPGRYFENTNCNNRFVLENSSSRVTLFYQPVIYNSDKEEQTGIGLYRNTSIPFPKNDDTIYFSGRYYTPDYLLKFEYASASSAKYLVADAKYSFLQTVKQREVAGLAYKYLFSISPTAKGDQIVGLCVFNGLTDFASDDTFTNIYDYELGEPIVPRACIVTLTENKEKNEILHDALLRRAIGVFTSESPQKKTSFTAAPSRIESEMGTPILSSLESEPALSAISVSSPAMQIPDQANNREALPKSAAPTSNKPKKKIVEILEQSLAELKLDKDIEERLLKSGYVSIGDLIPNQEKKDLLGNRILNRRSRREIEARLRQKRLILK